MPKRGSRRPPAGPVPYLTHRAPRIDFDNIAAVRRYLKSKWHKVMCTAHGALPSCSGSEATVFMQYRWVWRAYRKVGMPHSETEEDFEREYLRDYIGSYVVQADSFWETYLRYLERQYDSPSSRETLSEWELAQVKRWKKYQARERDEEEEQEERAEEESLEQWMAQAQIEWDEARDDREAEQAALEAEKAEQEGTRANQEAREDSEAEQQKNIERAQEKDKMAEASKIDPPRPKEEMVKRKDAFGVTDWDLYQAALQDINNSEDLISELSAAKEAESKSNTTAVADQHNASVAEDAEIGPSTKNEAKSHKQKNKDVEEDEEEYSGLGVKRRPARIAALDTKKARLT
ncbi:MAG: hypothetical protein Q9225_006302 [Loekoesia sp. 1 TL-2023]